MWAAGSSKCISWSLLAWSRGRAGSAAPKCAAAWESAVFWSVQPGAGHASSLECGLPCCPRLGGSRAEQSLHSSTAKACRRAGELP